MREICLIVCVVAVAVFTIRRGWKTDMTSLILKTVSSLLFVVLGCISVYKELTESAAPDPAAVFIIAGLTFGLVGDILLDLKYVHLELSDAYTFSGFAAFMCGHAFYTFFLMKHAGFLVTGTAVSLVIGAAAGILIYLTPKLMKLDYGRYRLISSVYAMILIFITVYSFFCMTAQGYGRSSVMMFAGLVLFLASDLILSQIYFGKDKNTPALIIANHALYYAGQILIAACAAYIA